MTPEQTVRAFFEALDAREIDRACALLAPDVVHTNGAGIAPLKGIRQVRYIYDPVVNALVKTGMDVQRVVADANVVSVVRDDVQVRPDDTGETVELRVPVAAVMTVTDDGLIAEWHDYWDIYAWAQRTGRTYEFFESWFALASIS